MSDVTPSGTTDKSEVSTKREAGERPEKVYDRLGAQFEKAATEVTGRAVDQSGQSMVGQLESAVKQHHAGNPQDAALGLEPIKRGKRPDIR